MIPKILSRPQWEHLLRQEGYLPWDGGPLNANLERWQLPQKPPYPVPVEADGSCDYWVIRRLVLTARGEPIPLPYDPDDDL